MVAAAPPQTAPLKTALAERTPLTRNTFSAASSIRDVAERWYADVQQDVADGTKSPNTARLYRHYLDRHTSHVFRKTFATLLDEGELSARQTAAQLGHAKVSMTQDNYLGRRLTNRRTAEAVDRAIRRTRD